jgi:DNA processing protein
MDREKTSAVLLNMIPEIGPKRFMALVNRFGSPAKVLEADISELRSVEQITEKVAEKIFNGRRSVDVEKEIELAEKLGVDIVLYNEKTYPLSLLELDCCPPVLYIKGTVTDKDLFSVGVVGTRRPTNYGRVVAEKFAKDLTSSGVTVVSGLARGIDTEAHTAALAAGGPTIAVVGCGLNRHYPPENRKLEEKIAGNGAVISEFPLNQEPDRQNFPRRNRLIAGISLGTLVVEADMKSGALITARYCVEQGKDVFAVPGQIFSEYSKGANYLIKSGAHLVEDARDIVEILQPVAQWAGKIKRMPAAEKPLSVEDMGNKDVFEFIRKHSDGVSIDVIAEGMNRPVSDVAVALFDLEVKGYIRSLPGKMYIAGL